MEAIIGKEINGIKVTSVKGGIVTYSKKVWIGSIRQTISKLKLSEESFFALYPKNCKQP